MLTRLHTEEKGLAMVISLMVTFVILLLSTVVVAQSIHSLDSSGYDRRRLTSVNAAEAGTNYYYQYFQTTPSASLSCSAVTRTVNSLPSASTFTATPTYYNASGTVMNCPFSDDTYPSYVLVNSVGTTASGAQRTFQSYIRLTPNYGGFSGALFSNSGNVSVGNNFNLYGNSGNNADMYVLNGNFSQTNNSTIRGSVFVPNGSATQSNPGAIQGDLWALNAISLNSVSGDVTSTTSTISGGTVGGNAKAAGAITSTVVGTKSQNQTGIANPPTQPFPQITYDASKWSPNYTIHAYTGATACTDARNFVEGTIPAGNHVVLITAATGATQCTYQNSNNSTVTMNGNLAIISDWGINISNQSDWNGVTSMRSLYFISVWKSPLTCATAGKGVSTGNNTNFNALVKVLFYTPCTLTLSNQNAFSGQGLGSPVSITNQFNLTYQPVLVPGITGITGFDQDIAYVREVV
jgi:hypothetical protein